MQREELIRRGVSPGLTHFVIEQGRTVTEHINSLTPDERHEFAELSRVGPWIIRQAAEYEAQPRDITEAHQASIEFAHTVRNTSRELIFKTPQQAREFVDLGERLCGENADGETKRVWFQQLYNRFLYERDPEKQQEKLAETMTEMRQWAAELAPLDPGRSALAYLYRVDRQTYTELQNEYGRDVPAKALEIVRQQASEKLERIDHERHSELSHQHPKDFEARALDAMRQLEPEGLGQIKGNTELELGLSAAEYLRQQDPDTYERIQGYDPRRLQHEALEILRHSQPEIYDLCHRHTTERFEQELDRQSLQTTYFDPEALRAPTLTESQAREARPVFSLQDAREAGLSFSEMRAAYSESQAYDRELSTEPQMTTMGAAFERYFNSHPTPESLAPDARAQEERDESGLDYDDPLSYALDMEEASHEIAEEDPGNSIRESARMSADYIIMGSVFETPPAPQGLLDRYESANRVFSVFEDRITDRIWNGSTIREIREDFNRYMKDIRAKEMGLEVRDHFNQPPEIDLAKEIRNFHSEISEVTDSVIKLAEGPNNDQSRSTYSDEARAAARELVTDEAQNQTVKDWLSKCDDFLHTMQSESRAARDDSDKPSKEEIHIQNLTDRLWTLIDAVEQRSEQERQADQNPGPSIVENLQAKIAINEIIINDHLTRVQREAGISEPEKTEHSNPTPIRSFRGAYEFLDNSYMPLNRQEITLDGVAYPTAQHALLAARTLNQEQREAIRNAPTPEDARRMTMTGFEQPDNRITPFDQRADWHLVRNSVSAEIERQTANNRATVTLDGARYPSITHAIEAARTLNNDEREAIRTAPTAELARQLGRNATERPDWSETRMPIMVDLLNQKFDHPEMAAKLLNTKDRPIINEDLNGGKYWAYNPSTNQGENALGRALTQVRTEIKERAPEKAPEPSIQEGMVISATGHRPDKLFGYTREGHQALVDFAEQQLKQLKPREVISGMALGWDQAVAQAAINLNIPLTAAVPFKGQESRWPNESQRYYQQLLSQATRVEVVSEGDYTAKKMETRNRWMVDNSDAVLSLWNGTPGGTANCVAYARDENKPIQHEWQDLQAFATERGMQDKLKEPELLSGIYKELEEETKALKDELNQASLILNQNQEQPSPQQPAEQIQESEPRPAFMTAIGLAGSPDRGDAGLPTEHCLVLRNEQPAPTRNMTDGTTYWDVQVGDIVINYPRDHRPQLDYLEVQHVSWASYDQPEMELTLNHIDDPKALERLQSLVQEHGPDSVRDFIASQPISNKQEDRDPTQQDAPAEAPSNSIVIEDKHGNRVAVPSIDTWKHFEVVTKRLRDEGEQPELAVFSQPKNNYISEPTPDEIQLDRHFNERLTELTEKDHPELSRLSKANDAINRGRNDRFREAAEVMKEGYDHQSGMPAAAYLQKIQQESKAARGQQDRQGAFSKRDVNLLITIHLQGDELRLKDKLKEVDPNERDAFAAQERHNEKTRREQERSREQEAFDKCLKELERTKTVGHVNYFFGRTLNETLNNGQHSDLYPTFTSLPKHRRDELHHMARERRTDMITSAKLNEVANITDTSPALNYYLSSLKEAKQTPGLSHKDALDTAWERLAGRIEHIRPGTSQAVADHIEQAKETQEKLQIFRSMQSESWTSAKEEANQNVNTKLQPTIEAFRAQVRTDSDRVMINHDGPTIGLSKDLEDFASTLGARMVAVDERGAYAVYPNKNETSHVNERLPEPLADHVQELTKIAQAGPQPNGGPNALEEQYIINNVSRDTKDNLTVIERSMTEFKLELANQFVDIDITANLQHDLNRETIQPMTQETLTREMTDPMQVIPLQAQAMPGMSPTTTATLTLETATEPGTQPRNGQNDLTQLTLDDEIPGSALALERMEQPDLLTSIDRQEPDIDDFDFGR